MKFKELFDETILPNFKEYVITNSKYSPVVTDVLNEQSKVFPIVTVNASRVLNNYGNLSYTEENYPFRIDINMYANDKSLDGKKISKITIANELSNLVETYFKSNYKVTINRQDNFDNIDGTIRRNFIRVSGVLDTKFGENNYRIYPQ